MAGKRTAAGPREPLPRLGGGPVAAGPAYPRRELGAGLGLDFL